MSAKILVVDDSQLLAKLVHEQLRREGYQVRVAHDGPTALEIAEAWEPDLVLLDVMMPGMDGFEVCRRMRQLEATADASIIMLTSMSSIADKTAGFEAGADDYITKPFEEAELKLRVAAQLRRKRMLAGQAGHELGRVITVFSLRGGAGCSSLAVNMAVGLTLMWDLPVVLFDLALPVGLCDVMLNLKPRYNLGDLAERSIDEIDADLIEGYLAQHETGLRFFGGSTDPAQSERVTDNLISYALGHLRENYAYIVVDTSHSFAPPVLAALDAADKILMPLTPDINSVRVGAASLKVFDSLGYPEDKTTLVLNWTFSKSGLATGRVEEVLHHPVEMVIPHAEGIWSEAINVGRPVITGDPESPLVAMLEDAVWRLSRPVDRRRRPAAPTRMWQRVTQRMKQRRERQAHK